MSNEGEATPVGNGGFVPDYVPRMAPQPLAELFVKMFGHYFLWFYDIKKVGAYMEDREDKRWVIDEGDSQMPHPRLYENVGDFLARMVDVYNAVKEGEEPPEKLVGRQLYTGSFIADVTKIVQSKLDGRVRFATKMAGDPDKLGIARGRTLDLTTGEIHPMDYSDYMAKRTTIAPDPNCPTPNFDEFLSRITLEDSELAAYLLRHGGYCLSGHVSEECVDFWLGESASNGKSTLANIYRSILRSGAYFTTLNFASLTDANSNDDEHQLRTVGRLFGARIAIAMEGKSQVKLEQALFNRLTSSDELLGKVLFTDAFSFPPTHKLVIGSNYPPTLQVDGASHRRLHMVPFNARFVPEKEYTGAPATFLRDNNFAAKLEAEMPGIFHKLVMGGLDWRERGGLDMPKAVTSKTAEYWAEADVFGEWLRDHKAADDFFTPTATLFKSYTAFMEGRGKAIKPEEFGRELHRRGHKDVRKRDGEKQLRRYLGIKP